MLYHIPTAVIFIFGPQTYNQMRGGNSIVYYDIVDIRLIRREVVKQIDR